MKWIVRISVFYFPLALLYKLFGQSTPIPDSYKDEYWVNSYWFITAIYFMLIFLNLVKFCDYEEKSTAKTYKKIIRSVAIYWGIMAALRSYLFFNIELYSKLISRTNTLTIGAITIICLFIYISAKNDPKSER